MDSVSCFQKLWITFQAPQTAGFHTLWHTPPTLTSGASVRWPRGRITSRSCRYASGSRSESRNPKPTASCWEKELLNNLTVPPTIHRQLQHHKHVITSSCSPLRHPTSTPTHTPRIHPYLACLLLQFPRYNVNKLRVSRSTGLPPLSPSHTLAHSRTHTRCMLHCITTSLNPSRSSRIISRCIHLSPKPKIMHIDVHVRLYT